MINGYYTNNNNYNQITILINDGYSYNIKIKKMNRNNTDSLSTVYLETLKIYNSFYIDAIIKEFNTYDINFKLEIIIHKYIKLKIENYNLYNPLYIIKNKNKPLLIFKNIGIDLTRAYDKFIKISILDRIKMVIGLFKEIIYLGSNNIIHNDIKPQNIILTEDNQLVLIDFGNAYIMENQKYMKNIKIKTTLYCSSIFYTIEGIQNNKLLMVEHLQAKACLYILMFILSYENHLGFILKD
jgi:serine/threonine protein kinase